MRVLCSSNGHFLDIPHISAHEFLNQTLIEKEWDFRFKRTVVRYHHFKYDHDTETLHCPAYMTGFLINYMRRWAVECQVIITDPNPYVTTDIKYTGLLVPREDQLDPIDFLTKDLYDKPMRALSLTTGCLTGDMVINLDRAYNGFKSTLKNAYNRFNQKPTLGKVWDKTIPTFVRSFTGKNIGLHEIDNIVYSGVKPVYRVTLENDRYVNCTINHEIMTNNGWVKAENIVDSLVMYDDEPYSSIPEYSKAISIEYIGEEDTYDIVCKAPYHNFVANGIVVHNSGKTFIGIQAILKLQRRSMIVLPANLVSQWTDVISNLTTAKVSIIRGNNSIYDIVDANYQIDSDIILTSIQTLSDYAIGGGKYAEAPKFQDFIRDLKVGIKLVDECHLNFNANLMVDIQSNVDRNIYLSATHVRGSLASKTIFNRVYPTEIRLGELAVSDHINVTEVRYNVGEIDQKRISTDRGYSQVKYEKYLLHQTRKFERLIELVFKPIVREYFIKIKRPNQKLLILVGRVDFAELLVSWLKEDFPEVVSEGYFNSTPDEVLVNSDIIISTVGSCGVGRDIKGLRTLILFTSFSSEPLIYQTIGRLRKMEDTPEFLYLVNSAIPAQIRHAKARQIVYKNSVKNFSKIDL